MADDWQHWVSILKVEDARKSEAFYCGILGFEKKWEHQFANDFPLYIEVVRGPVCLHISEHSGGGTRNGDMFIHVENVDKTYAELVKRGLVADGSPEDREYGMRDFGFFDPDGHHFTLGTNKTEFDKAAGRKIND